MGGFAVSNDAKMDFSIKVVEEFATKKTRKLIILVQLIYNSIVICNNFFCRLY